MPQGEGVRGDRDTVKVWSRGVEPFSARGPIYVEFLYRDVCNIEVISTTKVSSIQNHCGIFKKRQCTEGRKEYGVVLKKTGRPGFRRRYTEKKENMTLGRILRKTVNSTPRPGMGNRCVGWCQDWGQ